MNLSDLPERYAIRFDGNPEDCELLYMPADEFLAKGSVEQLIEIALQHQFDITQPR